MNTDTLFDELQELKFGRQMQDVFFKQVSQHPLVLEKIDAMVANDAEDWAIASFQERLNYLFFNAISMIGQEEPSEMLEIVNAILSESAEAQELCDPLVRGAIKHLEQEEEYQAFKKGQAKPTYSEELEMPEEPEEEDDLSRLTKDELNDMIIDAYERNDMKEVERLRKMLGEALNINHYLGRLRLRS